MPEVIEFSLDKIPWRLIIPAVALLVGLFIGFAQTSNWDTILKWLYAAPFGRSDPLFGHDLGFYFFSLPVYELIRDWALLIIFLSAAISVCIYWVRGDVRLSAAWIAYLEPWSDQTPFRLAGSVFSSSKRAAIFSQRYDLLTSNNGVVFGAAYTDVHLRLPLLIASGSGSTGGGSFMRFQYLAYGYALAGLQLWPLSSPCRSWKRSYPVYFKAIGSNPTS